jgi:hypothetical protein
MRRSAWGCGLAVGMVGCYGWQEPSGSLEPEDERSAPEMVASVPEVASEPAVPSTVATLPRRDEPEVKSEAEEGIDEVEVRVAVSPNAAERLAMWSQAAVRLSDDDGASWRSVLRGDGRVWQVVLDDEDGVWALRGVRLGHRRADGSESWASLPKTVQTSMWTEEPVEPYLAFARGWIGVAVAHPDPMHLGDLLLTRDGGGHWRSLAMTATMSSASIATIEMRELSIDGREQVQLLVYWGQGVECGTTYTTVHRGPIHGTQLVAVAEYPEEIDGVALDGYGWSYGRCPDAEDDELCVHAPRPKHASLPWIPGRWSTRKLPDSGTLWTSGGRVFGAAGSRLVGLSRGRVTMLAEGLPADAELLAVDSAERALMRHGGEIVRREGDGSWTTLKAAWHE